MPNARKSKRPAGRRPGALGKLLTFAHVNGKTRVVCRGAVVAVLLDTTGKPEFAAKFAAKLARDAGAQFVTLA